VSNSRFKIQRKKRAIDSACGGFLRTRILSFALNLGECSTGWCTKGRFSLNWSGAKRQRVVDRWKGVRIMKIKSLREVKAKLSKIVKELPSEQSVVITKNGRPCAVLFPVTEETDLESMLLAQRKDFWQLLDRAHKEGEKKGFTRLEDLPD
jgi:prevent-host-death family protein